MGLEVGTYISDLVATNPVGATDPKSQGDDHLRLLKATIKASFPAVAGAVAASHLELSILDGATLSTAELNILDGVTLTAAQINDAARLSVANVFTNVLTTWQNSSGPTLVWDDSNAATDERKWFLQSTSGTFQIGTLNDAGGAVESLLQADRTGGAIITASLHADAITITGDTSVDITGSITFNSVNVTDFARLSQSNTFTGATQTISGTGPVLALNSSSGGAYVRVDSSGTPKAYIGNGAVNTGYTIADIALRAEAGGLSFSGNAGATTHFGLTAAGVLTTPGADPGEVGFRGTPPIAITSTGTTPLIASYNGKQLYVTGAGAVIRLDPMIGGFQCTIVNNTGGNITLTENGSAAYLAGGAFGSHGTRTVAYSGIVYVTTLGASGTAFLISGTGAS